MNPNVSWVHNDNRVFYPLKLIPGLVQGGELVTARATTVVKGAYKRYITDPLITHPTDRETEVFQVQHPRRPGSVLPEVR